MLFHSVIIVYASMSISNLKKLSSFLEWPMALFGVRKGFATRSENFNEIASVTSYLRKTIVTIAFVNDFVQGGRV